MLLMLGLMIGAAAFAVLFLFGAGIYFVRGALNPQRYVDRVRRRQGIDPMANVIDEAVYFRSLKRWSIFGAVTCFAGAVGIACIIYFGFLDVLPRAESMNRSL